MPVKVRILHTQGCTNTSQTTRRVRDVARDLGIEIEVEQELVSTQDEADELRFLGSPTVLVNGQDIDPAARGATAFGLT